MDHAFDSRGCVGEDGNAAGLVTAGILPPLAALLTCVRGDESPEHALIITEVAWVCSYLSAGEGGCVPAVVEAGLLGVTICKSHPPQL
jgi:hypothetical protein